MRDGHRERREFIAGTVASSILLVSSGLSAAQPGGGKKKDGDIPPTEDLMREHGVLRRILLVYDEAARRLAAGDASVVSVIGSAANIVHRFVEGYHERLEEEFVFPKLEKAGRLIELTAVLRNQHAAGRKLTEALISETKSGKAAGAEQRRSIVAGIQAFGRMYAPHAAWEDTELFPVYREQFSEAEFDRLGDRFEDQEQKLLGSGGFAGSLREVHELEKALGVGELNKFTPS